MATRRPTPISILDNDGNEDTPRPDHEEHGNEEAYANIFIRQRWQRGHAKTIKEQGNEEQNKPCVTDEVELLWITGKFKK